MNIMKTIKVEFAPENKFTMDPVDQVNEWLFWTLITIVALALMFWKSLGEREFGTLLTRSPAPPISATVAPAAPAPATPAPPAPTAPAAQ